MPSVNLAAVLHPTSVDQFLLDYFGSQPLEAIGEAARFAALEAVAAVEAVARDFERELEAPVRVEPICDVLETRRPQYDLIAIQVTGCTTWRLYGSGDTPSEEPARDSELRGGCALYLPRAFWYTVERSDRSGQCWLFQIQNPTGADLVAWMADKVKDHELFQRDIPRFAGPAEQAEYLARLRRTFAGAFRAPSLLRRYRNRLNRLAPRRAAGQIQDLIVLATPRKPTIFRADPETIRIFVGEGRDVCFPVDAAPLLQYVIDHAPAQVADFRAQFRDDFDTEELNSFLEALCRDGVIAPLQPEGGLR